MDITDAVGVGAHTGKGSTKGSLRGARDGDKREDAANAKPVFVLRTGKGVDLTQLGLEWDPFDWGNSSVRGSFVPEMNPIMQVSS